MRCSRDACAATARCWIFSAQLVVLALVLLWGFLSSSAYFESVQGIISKTKVRAANTTWPADARYAAPLEVESKANNKRPIQDDTAEDGCFKGGKIVAFLQAESTAKHEQPIRDDTALVRCFWPGDNKEVAQERLHMLNAGICSKTFCLASGTSQTSYSDSFVLEASAAQKGVITNGALFQYLVEEKAQCLFGDLEQDILCACEYPTFTEFCKGYIWEETRNWSLGFLGDSTARYFRAKVDAISLQLKQDRHVHNENPTKDVEILVWNKETLHHLYLPFVGELGHPLKQSPGSI